MRRDPVTFLRPRAHEIVPPVWSVSSGVFSAYSGEVDTGSPTRICAHGQAGGGDMYRVLAALTTIIALAVFAAPSVAAPLRPGELGSREAVLAWMNGYRAHR